MQNAIEVTHLSKHFGTLNAVNDVSFSVARGDVLGFLGPNGAGKSTTMKMITGFLEPSGGTVTVCGHDVYDEPVQLKQKIGYLPEGAPAYGEMTPTSFLKFIGEIRGLSGNRLQQRIRYVIDRIHLEAVVDQRIETLSKGYKRRVGLAQALLHDPEVLVMDEPTDGLDPNQKHEVRELIKEMARDKAIIISTHILEEVDAVCTRAIIIAGGRLLFEGTPVELGAQSRLHNALTISVNADSFHARLHLSQLEDVAGVEIATDDTGNTRLILLPRDGANMVAGVAECIKERGWTLTEMRLETGKLDEVFRDITTGKHTTQVRS